MNKINNNMLIQSPKDKFRYKCSQVFLFLCIMIFAISICLKLTYSVAPVYGQSMQPTLNVNFVEGDASSQDRVVLNYISNFHKGDIIIAQRTTSSTENTKYVIKRLIAEEGDSIYVDLEGNVYVNDELLVEEYAAGDKTQTYISFSSLKFRFNQMFEGEKLVLPKGYVFYLGDNRSNSTDCADYGPVLRSDIVAKVDYVIKSGENLFLSILKQIFS